MLHIPELVIGTAASHGAVTVLPLFASSERAIRRPGAPHRRAGASYQLAAHALASGTLEVCEVEGRGDVDQLLARNRGAERVLLLEGDHLLGARQNRMVTSSALVGGGRAAKLPVSCVEQGRWEGPRQFASAGAAAPAGVRRIVKQSVTASLLDRYCRAADQGAIWHEIARQQDRLRVESATRSLQHTYVDRADDIRAIASQLPCPPRATGLAIGIGGELVSIDVFDQPATCAFYWPRLVEGAALDSLGASRAGSVQHPEVARALEELASYAWIPVPPVGDGVELRARAHEVAASALVLDDQLVHLGAMMGGAVHSMPKPMRRELPDMLAGRYQIVARIGVGGSKEVFRATDLRGGPEVAIARVPYVDPGVFAREIESVRSVDSPYVPKIHEAFVDASDDGYVVMDLCDGPSLAQLADSRLPVAEAGPILLELARGLRAIHDARVLHRDIKPENIVLCPTERGVALKIIDFGISAQAASVSTAVGRVSLSGTFPYMAPEVLRGLGPDARSDVYAFGVCCYRLLVGEVPLPADPDESDFSYIFRLSRVEQHDLSRLPALPEPAGALLARILSGDRDQRPFMPEVVEVLARAFGGAALALPARQQAQGRGRGRPARSAPERALHIPVPVSAPDHVIVSRCARAPFVVLDPDIAAGATEVRAFGARGEEPWRCRVDARLVAGLRADLDRDGAHELYLAGPDRVVALEADGVLRYMRDAPGHAAVPTLAAEPDRATPRLFVDGHALEPRTGIPIGSLVRAYEGDGTELVHARDLRGVCFHAHALQAFRGSHGTGAAIVAHAGEDRFHVAQLEEERTGRSVVLGLYGPGGQRVRGVRVAACDLATGDAAAIARLSERSRPLFGPEHAPIAVLAPRGAAIAIVPLIGADPMLPSSISAFSVPDGALLWERRLAGRPARGRAVLGDLDRDGKPELYVGAGDGVTAYDPATGALLFELPGAGLPIAIGDPCGVGFAHLVTASREGLELWQGGACPHGLMQWTGPRGDLWRSGTMRVDGAPFGPI